MNKQGELTSLTNKIDAELHSFNTGYLEELAEEISDFMYKHDPGEGDDDYDLLDALGTLGSLLEDLVACFEATTDALKYLKSLVDK